ncbi:hypothetical protein V1514DRAFT_325181 [Lipomyces japonicus]|uniref:uncharacterized protein n=1 Tax=Lipomyces japonicus TaxID=56871 RepID=UPI0034CD3D72
MHPDSLPSSQQQQQPQQQQQQQQQLQQQLQAAPTARPEYYSASSATDPGQQSHSSPFYRQPPPPPPPPSQHPPPHQPGASYPAYQHEVQSWYGQASAPSSFHGDHQPEFPTDSSSRSQLSSVSSNASSATSTASTATTLSPQTGGHQFHAHSALRHSSQVSPRIAPPVVTFPFAPHPNAPSPTKGYPYAFPDPGSLPPPATHLHQHQHQPPHPAIPPPPPPHPPSQQQQQQQQHYATSPPLSVPNQAGSLSRASIDSYDRLSARSIDLDDSQHAASASTNFPGLGPYSRSPELRQTHKIAERKRRRDMSLLYEDLKDILPDEKGVKSSKHELLVRAISVIRLLQRSNDDLHLEVNELRARLGMPPKRAISLSQLGRESSTESSDGDEDEDEDLHHNTGDPMDI